MNNTDYDGPTAHEGTAADAQSSDNPQAGENYSSDGGSGEAQRGAAESSAAPNRPPPSQTNGTTARGGLYGWLDSLLGGRGSKLLPQAKLAGPMRWVIAIMVALTVIASAGGLALSNLVAGSRAELSGGVTVQILEPLGPQRAGEAKRAEAVLRAAPGIAEVQRVPDDEVEALLEPWLGDDADNESVPIPALIDVRLDGPVSPAKLDTLRSALAEAAPSARVDAQSEWLEPVFSAMSALQWLAVGLILLLAVTSGAAVWLAARSALGNNRDTIEIIHLLGGTDNQIARIFQRSVGIDAMLGGVAGFAIGLVVIFIFARQFAALNSGVVGSGGLSGLDWLLIILVPVGGVLIAVLTARLTVLTALRRML